MASEKILVAEEASKERVAFFASTMDAFLQDFMTKATEGDRLGSIVAGMRLYALCEVMSREYEVNVLALSDGSLTEGKVAEQAVNHVIEMCNANSQKCEGLMKDGVGRVVKGGGGRIPVFDDEVDSEPGRFSN